ncbi:hypothetical protein [Streptomyces griseus]|uniref:hypothetical protein n=1 Tax=Streptomyces griseus TaxID=1911 RepID=UPI000560D5C4|nr:hypothetical protein [Streptomyces griseus]
MEVDRRYTDTHGASIVGSAKLYRPAAGEDANWPPLAPVISKLRGFFRRLDEWDAADRPNRQLVFDSDF